MPYDYKYGKITVEREPGNPFTDDEIVVLFRSRDITIPALLLEYMGLCALAQSPPKHLTSMKSVRDKVVAWQESNWNLVKIPG